MSLFSVHFTVMVGKRSFGFGVSLRGWIKYSVYRFSETGKQEFGKVRVYHAPWFKPAGK